ncbi:uncharacterized protein BN646_00963 [Parabacteroides sp. CAG:409]|nr:uncharacterized protein BN646_00963 [Parabacteroides sp. CAG:409]
MALLSASNEKLPSISVMVPLVVPFTITLAPITGMPVASTMVPFTSLDCWFVVLDACFLMMMCPLLKVTTQSVPASN